MAWRDLPPGLQVHLVGVMWAYLPPGLRREMEGVIDAVAAGRKKPDA